MSKSGRPKIPEEKKCKPNDKLICDICGGNFTRSGRTGHNNSKKHQIYVKLTKTGRELLLKKDYDSLKERASQQKINEKIKNIV